MLRRPKQYIIVFVLLLIVISVLIATHWLTSGMRALRHVPQDLFTYIKPDQADQPIVKPMQQQAMMQDFIVHYFSPWTGKQLMYTNYSIQQTELSNIQLFTKNPGWGFNQHRYPPKWMQTIAQNMQIEQFPNYQRPGIVLHSTAVRVMPTLDATFQDLWQPGQNYPFDRLQQSWLATNTPVLILHISQDGHWALVLTHNQVGWVERHDLGEINAKLIQQWLQSGKYVAAILDHIPVYEQNGQAHQLTRVGVLYPLVKEEDKNYIVLVPAEDANHQVVIKQAKINKAAAVIVPWQITPRNIATVANPLLGDPYGWGELYGHRDCSATLMNLFTPFGVWLPRSSADQAQAWHYIDFSKLNKHEKEKMILQQGVPFFTLLDLDGHIMLYIGEYKGRAYAFHDVWGIHTFSNGRLVIGRTIISPATLGEGYINVRNLITAIRGMTILGLPQINKEPPQPNTQKSN